MTFLPEFRVVGFLDVPNSNFVETKKTNPNSKITEVVINTLSCQTITKKLDFVIIQDGGAETFRGRDNIGQPVAFVKQVLRPVTPEVYKNKELRETDQLAILVTEGNHKFILAAPKWIHHWHEQGLELFSIKEGKTERAFSYRYTDAKPRGLRLCPEDITEIVKAFISAKARLCPTLP